MAEETAQVNFRIGGIDAVARAVISLSESIERLARNSARSDQQTTASFSRESKKRDVIALTSEQAKLAAQRRAMQESNALLVKMHREEIRTFGDAVREHDKAEREKTASTKREAAERVRREKQAAKEAEAIRREEAAVLRTRTNLRREYARETIGGAFQGARAGVGRLAQVGAAAGAGALAYGLSAARSQASLESKASTIAIATREGDKSLDPTEMVKAAQKIAGEQGTKPEEVLDAIMAAAEHGEGRIGADTFLKNLPLFSKLGLATGTSLGDLAENSAALTSAGVTDAQVQKSVMLKIAGASKAGNIGLREMGLNLSSAFGATGSFEGDAASRAVRASALMQMARSGVGGAKSAEDASTAVRNFYNDVSSKHGSGLLADLGVETMGTGGKRRDAFEVYLDALDKAKGDPTKLTGILGMQSRSVGQAVEAAYAKDGRAGARAALGKFENAGMTPEEVNADAQRKMADASNRFAAELEKLRAAVGTHMLPLLSKYLPKMTEAVDKFITILDKPATIDTFVAGLDKAAQALDLVIKHPYMTGAAYVGLKTVVGGIEAAAGKFIGGLLAPVGVQHVRAGVVNVAGGVPGLGGGVPGGLPGGAPGLGGMGVLGTVGVVLSSLALAAAAVGGFSLAVVEADDYLRKHNKTYGDWSNRNWHNPNDGVARDIETGKVLDINNTGMTRQGDMSRGDRAKLSKMLGPDFELPAGSPMKKAGAALELPSPATGEGLLTIGQDPVRLETGSKVAIENTDEFADALAKALRKAGVSQHDVGPINPG